MTRFEVVGADDRPFAVTAHGEGPPVIVLHPGSSDAASWSRVAKRLADRFQVLRFERYTYRRMPGSGYGAMEAETSEVLAVADSLDEDPVLIGHSSGAVVALEAARAVLSAFSGLVLYDPPVAVDEPIGGEALRSARAAVDAGDPDQAIVVFLRDIAQFPRVAVSLLRLITPMWRKLRSFAEAQIADTEAIEGLGVGLDRYSKIDCPALLISGMLSPPHLRSKSEALAETLPNADLVILRRGGHGMHTSAPKKLADTIADFADRVFK